MTIALAGSNWYGIKSHSDELISEFVKKYGDISLEKIDAAETEFAEILSAVESLPFLVAKKMVVIKDLSANKTAAENLEQIINGAGEETELLIVEPAVDKRTSYYKQLKNLTTFHEYSELNEEDLAKWLVSEAKIRSAHLTMPDARFIVQRAGTDQLKLSHELDKLAQYDSKITKAAIEKLVDEVPASTVFNLIDSVFAGNLAKALKIYDDQRKLRVEPQAIHGLLVWQMHAVNLACTAPPGVSSSELAKESGISPFVMQKSVRIAQQMGRQKVSDFMQLLRDIDFRAKRQTFDYDEALRFAIISLAG